jgi:hypothetical protein
MAGVKAENEGPEIRCVHGEWAERKLKPDR